MLCLATFKKWCSLHFVIVSNIGNSRIERMSISTVCNKFQSAYGIEKGPCFLFCFLHIFNDWTMAYTQNFMSFFLFADLRRDQQVVHCLKSLRKKNTIFVVYCPLFFFSILQHFSKKSRWTAYGIRIARQIFKVGLLCLTLLYQVLWKLTFLQDPTIQWLVEPLLMAISWSNCVLYDFISLLHFNLQAFIYPSLF